MNHFVLRDACQVGGSSSRRLRSKKRKKIDERSWFLVFVKACRSMGLAMGGQLSQPSSVLSLPAMRLPASPSLLRVSKDPQACLSVKNPDFRIDLKSDKKIRTSLDSSESVLAGSHFSLLLSRVELSKLNSFDKRSCDGAFWPGITLVNQGSAAPKTQSQEAS